MAGGILAAMVIGFTISAFVIWQMIFGIASAFAWAIFGLWSYTQSTSLWDVYYLLFWFSMAMVIAMGLTTPMMKVGRKQEEKEYEDKQENKVESEPKSENSESHIDNIRKNHGLPPSEARERNKDRRRFFGR